MTRVVVLDTETTGLDPGNGHRIIEIGCVELLGRRLGEGRFHCYLNPERAIDRGAVEVHGITDADLQGKPVFAQIVDEFLAFIRDAELVIHNAPFDVGFLDMELTRLSPRRAPLADICSVTDTLPLARKLYPGQRNTLDALCRRLGVDNSSRQLHGALLDARLLASVYLAMTSGQGDLGLTAAPAAQDAASVAVDSGAPLAVLWANAEEVAAHERCLDQLDQACEHGSVWRREASRDGTT